MSKTTKWAVILSTLMGLYAAVGFLIAPPIIRSQLESTLTEQLGHPVTVKEVRLNPFALSLTLRDLSISERDQTPLLGFEEFYVNLELASLVNQAVTFSAIRLIHPYAIVRVNQDGTLNLADLRPSTAGIDPQDTPPAPVPSEETNEQPLPGLIVDLLEMDGGILEFHDDSQPTPFTADIVPISFTLQHFSTRPDSPDVMHFIAEIGPGEKIEWHGAVHIQPLDSEGRLTLTGLKARTLWSYIQDRVNFEVTDGLIDLTAVYQVKFQRDDLQASLTDGSVSVTTLTLAERGFRDPVIVVPEFSVDGIEADLSTHTVRIAAVRTRDARIDGWLYPDRRTSFHDLFITEGTSGATPTSHPSAGTPQSPAAPWSVKIAHISIDNYGITVEDRAPATPVRLTVNPLRLTLEDVSTKLDAPIALDFSARINESGSVSVKGSVTPDPLSLDVDVDVGKVAFPPFQPYVDRVARVNVKSGAASMAGHLSYRAKPAKQPQIQFRGKAAITELVTQDAALGKDLIKWTELAVNGIAVDVEPTKAEIAEIVVTRPYVSLIIAADRTTNVQELFIKPDSEVQADEAPPPPTQTSQPLAVRIGLVRLVEGSGHFADFSIKPVIDTGIFDLNGTVKGLSSQELSKADVSLRGKVDKYAPMAVKGTINPLASDAFTDIGISFKNVELTTVSPYSTKFVGYPIKKGKISLDLRYKLSHKVLEAENDVLIEQLTLGDKVESPDAVSLPMKLAVALLKDRNGVIDIDLPIRGDLNDPDFKYGRVLLGVLMNLVTKAVTSPFNLVAGLVGGSGEELSHVLFQAGAETLSPDEETKLKTVAKALDERPELRLEIAGAADAQADRAALAEIKLHRELVALKDGDAKTGQGSESGPDTFRFLPEAEQAALIKTLYRQKYGALPEPSPAADGQATPTPAPMQSLKDRLRADTPIEDAELRRLAQDRGKLIQQFLVTQGSINPERLYMLEVQVNATAKDGTVPSSLNLTAE